MAVIQARDNRDMNWGGGNGNRERVEGKDIVNEEMTGLGN